MLSIKSKFVAGFLLVIICVFVVGIIYYFVKSTDKNVISKATLAGKTIPLVMSFEYQENRESDAINRVMSIVLFINISTQRFGLLELPSYIGVTDPNMKIIVPLDYYFVTANYKKYFDHLQRILDASDLQYIFITKNNLSKFIDLIGGVEVFMVHEDINTINNAISDSEIGDVKLDGPSVSDYLYKLENSSDDELLKSTKRKEFIYSILSQLQNEKKSFANSDAILKVMEKYMDTSLNTAVLRNILTLLSEYNLDQAYFQRVVGQLQRIDISNIANQNIIDTSLLESKILFTSLEAGNLSQIYSSIENKITKSSSEKIGETITITILNGTVINGLAKTTKKLYEDAGFDVVSIDNTPNSDVETTTIIDRVGNVLNANFAAQIIGAKSIITDITSIDKAGANLTLILGKDFDGKRVK